MTDAQTITSTPENTPAFTYSFCSNCAYKRYWSQPTEAAPRMTYPHLPQCFECLYTVGRQGHIVLKHERTGRVLYVDKALTPLYTFATKVLALQEIALDAGLVLSLLTVTLGKQVESPYNDLHPMMQKIKRRIDKVYGPGRFQWTWVLEWQPSRLEAYAVLAQHYHILIAAPPGCMPNYKFVQDATRRNHYQCVREGDVIKELWIKDTWARGLILCTDARIDVKPYLEKYMIKNLNDKTCPAHSKHLRLFASSKDVTKLAIPKWAKLWKEEWERDGQLDDPTRDYKFAKHRMQLLENKVPILIKRSPYHPAPTAKEIEEASRKELQAEVRMRDDVPTPSWELGPNLRAADPPDEDTEAMRQLRKLEQAVFERERGDFTRRRKYGPRGNAGFWSQTFADGERWPKFRTLSANRSWCEHLSGYVY